MVCTKETVKTHGLNVWVDGSDVGHEPKVDVVLVQGLNAHPYHTWAYHRRSDENKESKGARLKAKFSSKKSAKKAEATPSATDEVFWPRDLLPSHLQSARIATYSYPSDWRSKDFATTLSECGEQLLNVLHQYRITVEASIQTKQGLGRRLTLGKSRTRPLVFIGHSLGGLVIQQALVVANHGNDFADIRESTAGAIFLGAPTQGCDAARLAAWTQRALGNDQPLLRTLQAASNELLSLSRYFWSSYGQLPITCFFENSDSQYGPLAVRTVSSQSATLVGKRRINLETDHSGLNKFWGEEDENFQLFLPELKIIVSHAIDQHHKISTGRTSKIILPFPRDKHFIDRGDIMDRIEAHLKDTTYSPRVALVGLGGVGKSQLAIEFAHRLRGQLPQTSIFWVHASSFARFQESYEAIAKQLRLPGFDDPKTDLLNAVYQWLLSESSGSWLLILDNADDVNLFQHNNHNGSGRDFNEPSIRQYLPQRAGGAMLIASRDRDAAFALVPERDHVIDISAMSQSEARSLVNSKIGVQLGNDHDKDELASALDCIPLAITQAIAYINKKQRMTVAKYLNLLKKDEEEGAKLLGEDLSDLRRDPKVHNSVIRTWQISFQQIQDQHPFSADLLSRMSMFDRQGIPEFLLRVDMSDREFEDGLEMLLGYAFINMEADETTFNMHRLVQLAMREWLRTQKANEKHQTAALRMLHEVYPNGQFENWVTCSLLEPHAQMLLSYQHVSVQARRFQAYILYNRAWYYRKQGNYGPAEGMAKKAMGDSLELLGQEDIWTLGTMNELALTYREQGRFREARDLQMRVVETRRKVLGQEHFQTVDSMSSLASVLIDLGQWEEAEDLGSQVLRIRERVLGHEHSATVTSMSILSTILSKQQRLDKAEELALQILEIRKRILGQQHPDTLTTMNNLANIYNEQGRWEEADRLALQVLETRISILGREHSETLITMSNLANTYYYQKRWLEAEKLGLQVLETQERVLGQEHPQTLNTISNLALVYRVQARYEEAEKLDLQVLEASKRVLGQEHPDTLLSMHNFAFTLKAQGRVVEALSLMERCCELRKKVLSPEHPDTTLSIRWLIKWRSETNEAET